MMAKCEQCGGTFDSHDGGDVCKGCGRTYCPACEPLCYVYDCERCVVTGAASPLTKASMGLLGDSSWDKPIPDEPGIGVLHYRTGVILPGSGPIRNCDDAGTTIQNAARITDTREAN